MTMMNIRNCECDVISTIEYWWSELNISKQSYSRPEMRRNVRGSASFPSTVATASPSLLVLIGGLRLRHVSSIETGCWLPSLPIYTILSSSITHVPIEFSFCLECFSSGQKILHSQYSTTNCWDVFSLLTKFWNRYKSWQNSFWKRKLIWTQRAVYPDFNQPSRAWIRVMLSPFSMILPSIWGQQLGEFLRKIILDDYTLNWEPRQDLLCFPLQVHLTRIIQNEVHVLIKSLSNYVLSSTMHAKAI